MIDPGNHLKILPKSEEIAARSSSAAHKGVPLFNGSNLFPPIKVLNHQEGGGDERKNQRNSMMKVGLLEPPGS